MLNDDGYVSSLAACLLSSLISVGDCEIYLGKIRFKIVEREGNFF